MIRVIVELVPFGNEEQKKKIAEIEIANIGNSEKNYLLYNYYYKGFLEKFSFSKENEPSKIKFSGKVVHARTENVLILLFRVLKNILKIY